MSLPPASICVQHLGLQRLVLGTCRVELAHARVEVPAVVVELAGDPLDLGERLLLEVQEAHHDVGHLDAGVVDVVLDAHVEAAVAQQPHERVAEAGVAQVADVGGLVGVDARVLDDHVPRASGRREPARRASGAGRAARLPRSQEQVQVAAAGDLGAPHVARRSELAGEPLRDLARLAPQRLGEVEGGRQGQVAELDAGRILEGDGCRDRCRKRRERPALPPPKGVVGDPGSQQSILPCTRRALRDLTSFDPGPTSAARRRNACCFRTRRAF